jgi:hypothetical protein
VRVFAQAGLYTFLALRPPSDEGASAEGALATTLPPIPLVLAAAALAPEVKSLCAEEVVPRLARHRAVDYWPLIATNAGGRVARVIENSADPALRQARTVLDDNNFGYQLLTPPTRPRPNPNTLQEMIDDIVAVSRAARGAVVWGEVGHGLPNEWTNVRTRFAGAGANVRALGAGLRGFTTTADLFSCLVAQDNDKAAGLDANHVQTVLATELTPQNAGGTASVRAVNVEIFIITGSPADPDGVFQLKTVSPNTQRADEVTITCSHDGRRVTCARTMEVRIRR